jgi:hypothetical protein
MTKSNYLAVCAIYRDEGPYLREWVEFHRLVGVERFFLYDNLSTDDHAEILRPYVEEGLVELNPWPIHPAQIQAYEDCLLRHRGDTRWIAFIDLDEFLFSPLGRPLPDVLAGYEQYSGVGVNWAVFGTSGHRTRPEGLVLENFTRRTDRNINKTIKSIVDPSDVRAFCVPHFFMLRSGPTVDENGRPITRLPFSATDEVSFERLRVNHYATKSEEEFRSKLSRGHADATPPKSQFARQASGRRSRRLLDENDIQKRFALLDKVTDTTAQMYLPDLKRAMGES